MLPTKKYHVFEILFTTQISLTVVVKWFSEPINRTILLYILKFLTLLLESMINDSNWKNFICNGTEKLCYLDSLNYVIEIVPHFVLFCKTARVLINYSNIC